MTQIRMEASILGANDLLARRNRGIFARQGTLVVNLMSSPGSGKTTVLERSIDHLHDRLRLGVIEGDLYTDQDARRIEKKGVPVKQINTQGACHLDAGMVGEAFASIGENLDLLFIENVGNLVCPAEFDLGEDFKAVVISTTEGNDKPSKYPLVFREARVVLLNKIDLLPFTDFSVEQFREDMVKINPQAPVFMVSGRTGEGFEEWIAWLLEEVRNKRAEA
ncbi:MAG: hydrogenase nickel incorporation protein HypB [Syntrophomonadales bacterium]